MARGLRAGVTSRRSSCLATLPRHQTPPHPTFGHLLPHKKRGGEGARLERDQLIRVCEMRVRGVAPSAPLVSKTPLIFCAPTANRSPSPLVLFEGRRCRRRMRGVVQSDGTRSQGRRHVSALLLFGNVAATSNAPSSDLRPPSPPQKTWGRRRSIGKGSTNKSVRN